jgi:hypothetical protein
MNDIVTICGSTRFVRELQRTALRESLKGNVVLLPTYMRGAAVELYGEEIVLDDALHAQLMRLHRKRMMLASRIVAVTPGGYIGLHLQEELDFAMSNELPIEFVTGAEPLL